MTHYFTWESPWKQNFSCHVSPFHAFRTESCWHRTSCSPDDFGQWTCPSNVKHPLKIFLPAISLIRVDGIAMSTVSRDCSHGQALRLVVKSERHHSIPMMMSSPPLRRMIWVGKGVCRPIGERSVHLGADFSLTATTSMLDPR